MVWYKCIESFEAHGEEYEEGEEYPNLADDILEDYEGCFEKGKEIESTKNENPFA